MATQLSNSNRLLEESKQPYSFLIESMRKRDHEIEERIATIAKLEAEVAKLDGINKQLRKKNHVMSSDLDRLLGHQQEMSIIKRVIANMGSPRQGNVPANLMDQLETPQYKADLLTQGDSPRRDVDGKGDWAHPKPIVFTKSRPSSFNPERYRKMRDLIGKDNT